MSLGRARKTLRVGDPAQVCVFRTGKSEGVYACVRAFVLVHVYVRLFASFTQCPRVNGHRSAAYIQTRTYYQHLSSAVGRDNICFLIDLSRTTDFRPHFRI